MKKVFILVALFMILISYQIAWGTTLSGRMTVDNGFNMWISTSDVWGTGTWTLISSDFSEWGWTSTHPFAGVNLTPGVKNYLNVEGTDWGAGAGFLGSFALSDTNFQFSNGGQILFTNIIDWNMSEYSFDGIYGAIITEWTTYGRCNDDTFKQLETSGAKWIWTNGGTDIYVNRYFSTEITPVTGTVPVASVSINKTILSLNKGISETLIATVSPSNASNKAVTWSSNNTSVATVDSNGKVTAVGEGTCTITVVTSDGSKTANCEATVLASTNPVTVVYSGWEMCDPIGGSYVNIGPFSNWWPHYEQLPTESGVWISAPNSETAGFYLNSGVPAQSIPVYVKYFRTKIYIPASYTGSSVIISVEKDDEVSYYVDGQVVAQGAPSNLTSYVPYGNEFELKVLLCDWAYVAKFQNAHILVGNEEAVYSPNLFPISISVTGVTLNETTLSLNKNTSETLVATVSPSYATNNNVTWSSSNNAVATINASGLVTAVNTGSSNITVTTDDGGFTATCEVTVTSPINMQGDWYMFRHDLQHTARSPFLGPDTPTKKWEFQTGQDVQSSPAIDSGGIIYLGSSDGKLYAIYPNGTKKWEFQTGGYVRCSSPAIDSDGTIYVGSCDSKLYAINPNGTKKWELLTGNLVDSSPAIGSDGTIYVGSKDSKLYAINPNGTKKWEFQTNNWIGGSSPAIDSDGTIYVGSRDSKLYAINPNGTKKWEFLTGGWVNSSPSIGADGTIYAGSDDGKLYGINPNGTKKWEFQAGSIVYSSAAIGSDETIYVGSDDGKLYAINPNGSKKWEFQTGYIVSSSPSIDSDGTIYVGSDSNKFYAINPDGSMKWEFQTGDWVRSSAAIGSDGTIYVGSFDNKLYAIGPYVAPVPTYTINGTVKLKDFYSLKTGITGTAIISDGINTETHEIVLDVRGKYSFTTSLSGICSITIKCSHWLSKSIYDVDIVDGINIGEVNLTNGDVVDNNEVDFSDINAVRAAYGSIDGDENWNERADVDRTGEVDFNDINIVRGNYGEIGE